MGILDEPVWTIDVNEVQKAFNEKDDALCNRRFTPSIVTGVLLRLLQAHFSDADNIRDEKLKSLVWTDDDPDNGGEIDSKILIGPLYKYDARQLQQRPAVVVMREETKARKLPLDSKYVTSLDADGQFKGDRYVLPVSGAHVARCIGATAFAADRLGEEVFYRLLEYGPAIKREFPFGDIEISNMTAPRKVDDGDNESFVVDVVVKWVHLHGWTLTPIAPILKKVRFEDTLI